MSDLEIIRRRPEEVEPGESVIYAVNGDVIGTRRKSDLLRETAKVSWYGWNVGPYSNPDDLVAKKSDGLAIYRKMTAEPEVAALLEELVFGVTAPGWRIIPHDDLARSREIADFVKRNLAELGGPTAGGGWCSETTSNFFWSLVEGALVSGFSLGEKNWMYADSRHWLDNVKWKDPESTRFETDAYGNLLSIVYSDPEGGDVPLNVEKFIPFPYLPRFSNWYGTSRLRRVYRAWWLKDLAWRMRGIFAEKRIGGHVIGKYPRRYAHERSDLITMMKQLQTESVSAIPEDVVMEVVQLATSDVKEWQLMIQDLNREMRIGLVGSTIPTEETVRGGGARSLGETHQDVRAVRVDFIGKLAEEAINLFVVRDIVRINFVTEDYPTFSWNVRKEKSRQQMRSEDRLLFFLGAPISYSWLKERYEYRPPVGDEPFVQRTDLVGGGGTELIGPPEPDAPDYNYGTETKFGKLERALAETKAAVMVFVRKNWDRWKKDPSSIKGFRLRHMNDVGSILKTFGKDDNYIRGFEVMLTSKIQEAIRDGVSLDWVAETVEPVIDREFEIYRAAFWKSIQKGAMR